MDAPDERLIEEYVSGTLPPEHEERVTRWIQAGSREARAAETMRRHAARPYPELAPVDLDAFWRRIERRLDTASEGETTAVDGATSVMRLRRFEGRTRYPWLRRPTGVAMLGVTGFLIAIVATKIVTSSAPLARAATTITTNVGERRVVTIDDGSHVTLAPGSELIIPATFGVSERTVSLQGEAYFDIRRDARAPFVVRTGTTQIRVLGTAFDVRRYAEDRAVTVAVHSGKIGISNATRAERTIVAGQLARVTDSVLTVDQADASVYTAWTSGHLVFRDAPVADVLTTLEHWYGVQFAITDSATINQRVTTALDYGDRHDVIRALEVVLEVTATERTSGTSVVITLQPNRRTRRTGVPDVRQKLLPPYHSEVGR